MTSYVDDVVEFINKNINVKLHSTAIIISSDFSNFLDCVDNKQEIYFRDIPNFKVLGDDYKENKFVFGKIKNRDVIVSVGRLHFNYGYEPSDIAFCMFVLKELGCDKVVVSASFGSLNPKIKVGDIVTCVDHINMTGRNPLYKCSYKKYGKLFVDMMYPYSTQMIDVLTMVAKREMAIKVKKGVLAELNGPSVETSSESRLCKIMGADFTGFNVVCEAIACKYCKLPIVVVGLITNYAPYFAEDGLKHDDIVYNRNCASKYYLELLRRFVEKV